MSKSKIFRVVTLSSCKFSVFIGISEVVITLRQTRHCSLFTRPSSMSHLVGQQGLLPYPVMSHDTKSRPSAPDWLDGKVVESPWTTQTSRSRHISLSVLFTSSIYYQETCTRVTLTYTLPTGQETEIRWSTTVWMRQFGPLNQDPRLLSIGDSGSLLPVRK